MHNALRLELSEPADHGRRQLRFLTPCVLEQHLESADEPLLTIVHENGRTLDFTPDEVRTIAAVDPCAEAAAAFDASAERRAELFRAVRVARLELAGAYEIPAVAGPAACSASAAGGWYFDDPVEREVFEFCPCTASCLDNPASTGRSSTRARRCRGADARGAQRGVDRRYAPAQAYPWVSNDLLYCAATRLTTKRCGSMRVKTEPTR